jgi:hypothetical protein
MRQLGQVPCLLATLQARVTSAKLKESANQAIFLLLSKTTVQLLQALKIWATLNQHPPVHHPPDDACL